MIKTTTKYKASLSLVIALTVGFATSMFAQNTIYGDNIIKDGDFSEGTGTALSTNWTADINTQAGASATINVTNGELSFTNIAGATQQFHVQAYQTFTAEQISELELGSTFELTFDARTTAASKIVHVFLGEAGGSWARYWSATADGGAGDVTITNTKTTYTLTTDIDQTWTAMRLGFEVSKDASDLFIDNVVLRKADDNILRDGDFATADPLAPGAAWKTDINSGAAATIAVTNGVVGITAITPAGSPAVHHVQVLQEFTQEQIDAVEAGPYEIIFDAYADADKSITVFFGKNAADFDNFGQAGYTVNMGTTLQTYTIETSATGNFAQMKFGFEVGADATNVYFDNVIVRKVSELTPDAPTFTLATVDGVVTITVNAQDGVSEFEVFWSNAAFSETNTGVSVGTINPTDGLTLTHSIEAPHSTLATDYTAHYGVVAKAAGGTTSGLTTDSILTGMTTSEFYIVELEDADATALAASATGGTFPDAATITGYFPEGYTPFTIDSNRKIVEEGAGGDDDADISGKMWVGFGNAAGVKGLIFYAEIMDDNLVGAPSTGDNPSGGAWSYDNWEVGIGAYSPASFIVGSDHQDFEIGNEPDYQFRAGFFGDGNTYVHVFNKNAPPGTPGHNLDQALAGSITLADQTLTGGYRLLTLVVPGGLLALQTGNADFAFPTGTGVTTVPFIFVLNDRDDGDTNRDTQISWSTRAGQNDWWNTPARWETVAMVGRGAFPVANERDSEEPVTFSLDQNYPNPFNPATNISFTLPSASEVTLEVFNMLGQKVAVLLQGEKMSVGTHTQKFDASSLASGIYVYRLNTPSFVQSRKMMLIK